MPVGPNLQKLINKNLVKLDKLPNATDAATIERLSPSDVDALIRVYETVGAPFLSTNCNVSDPSPGASRIIGIVF